MNPLLDILLKGAVVLLIALALTGFLRDASAAVRHGLWSVGFAALLLLPLAGLALPSWEVRLPEPVANLVTVGPAEAVDRPAGNAESGPPSKRRDPRTEAGDARLSAGLEFAPERTATNDVAGPVPTPASGRASLPGWPMILLGVWGLGAALLVGRLAVGLISVAWITRRSRPLNDLRWELSATRICGNLGIHRRVRLLSSAHVEVPVTCGLFRPAVLVPENAREWSGERREVVLMHELAHVARRDCLTQVLADAVRALHWINPLAWVGSRAMRAEQERACDDLVLTSAGAESSDYAHHLIEIARGMTRRRPLASAALAMARPSQLEGRVLAVLDPTRDRRTPNRVGSVVAAVVAGLLLLPLAAFQPVPGVAGLADVENGAEPEQAVESPDADRESGLEDSSEPAGDFLPKVLERVAGEDLTRASMGEGALEGVTVDGAARDTIEERVVEVFVRALRSEDASMRSQAASALGRAELPQAVEPLAAVVTDDPSANVRSQAAWALGMIEDAGGVSALLQALSDASDNVRSQAAWALGMIESDRAVDGLSRALEDEDRGVRSQAAWALGMIESDAAVPGLVRALQTDESAGVRNQAAWALGMIESDVAVEALIDAIEDSDPEVSRQAMWALGRVIGG